MIENFSLDTLKELHQLWSVYLAEDNACFNTAYKNIEDARNKYYEKLKELDIDFNEANDICWYINNNYKDFYKGDIKWCSQIY